MAGFAVISPHQTPIAVNYFASASSGVSINCGDFSAGKEPLACTQASTTAVRYVSVASFFSYAILGLVISPVVGWLSDSYGRKPFFLFGVHSHTSLHDRTSVSTASIAW
jgi:MFS family permease